MGIWYTILLAALAKQQSQYVRMLEVLKDSFSDRASNGNVKKERQSEYTTHERHQSKAAKACYDGKRNQVDSSNPFLSPVLATSQRYPGERHGRERNKESCA